MRSKIVLLLLLASTSSFAQGAPAEEPPVEVRYRARTDIVISDMEIEGAVKGPTGTIYRALKKRKVRNLIELRSNFRPELATSPSAM